MPVLSVRIGIATRRPPGRAWTGYGRAMAGPPPIGEWDSFDALLLTAIARSRRGTSLDDVMARTDALDKSYPTRDQLASALGALAAAGLIEESAHGFRRTAAGKALTKRTGFFGRHRDLVPYLNEVPRQGDDWPLTDADVTAAVDTYLRRRRRRG
jgi:hypothetical protein